jgi:N-formylglutamate amidohydrolase
MTSSADAAPLLDIWVERERRYRANAYRGTGRAGELWVDVGSTPVLVTAGHSVAQLRDGARKKPDLRTGGLAEVVGQRTGASVLTALGSSRGDPNRDLDHPFKRALRELAPGHRYAIDLHGMTDSRGIDVCIGSGPTPSDSLVDTCRATAQAAGLLVTVDVPFSATRRETITATAQRSGLEAVQLEIAARRRDPVRAGSRALSLVEWLIELVTAVARA